MFTDDEIEEIIDFLAENDGNVYIGCDSKRLPSGNRARFVLVLVVHINNRNGCKVFSFTTIERIYEKNKKRPSYRLMREVQLVSELFLKIAPFVEGERDIEVHLDINPDRKHFSSDLLTEAIAYVMGQTGRMPKVKPDSFAATRAADALTRG